jgi:hypothetical protein
MDFQLENTAVECLRGRTPSPDCFHSAFMRSTSSGGVPAMNPPHWNMMEFAPVPAPQPMNYIPFLMAFPVVAKSYSNCDRKQLEGKGDASEPRKNRWSKRANSMHDSAGNRYQKEEMAFVSGVPKSIPGTPPTDVGSDGGVMCEDSNEESDEYAVDAALCGICDLPAKAPSPGSVGHPHLCAGACKYNSRKGCKEGDSCNRCHLCVWTRSAERKHVARRRK